MTQKPNPLKGNDCQKFLLKSDFTDTQYETVSRKFENLAIHFDESEQQLVRNALVTLMRQRNQCQAPKQPPKGNSFKLHVHVSHQEG